MWGRSTEVVWSGLSCILKLAELGLGVCLLRLPGSLPSTSFLGTIVWDRQGFDDFARRWGGETVNVLLDRVS